MRRASAFLTCSLFVLAAAVDGRGQAFQGGLRGAVRDPGGAVIPGAEVALVNEATNVSRSTVTNEVGEYNFSSVAPGTYRIRVSTAGFKAYEQSGVNIGTQQFITLDVKLEVGAVSEQIQVIADASLIETSNANTGGLLTETALKDLPNTGRNPFMMALTV